MLLKIQEATMKVSMRQIEVENEIKRTVYFNNLKTRVLEQWSTNCYSLDVNIIDISIYRTFS